MKRVQLQPAYVLHRRLYRETSFLVELFTPEYGRLTVIARGMRKPKSPLPGLLQPFVPLLVSWAGSGELMTLANVEPNGLVKHLKGESLYAGFYLNELLMCLLQRFDAHGDLYKCYERTLELLQHPTLEEKTLRSFEKLLLEELGYGLFSTSTSIVHQKWLTNKYYRFIPDHGLVENEGTTESDWVFIGKSLVDFANEDWRDEKSLADAKRLVRLVLIPLLGNRQINSRKLFL